MVRARQLTGVVGMAMLVLAGCDVAYSARRDFDRLVSDGPLTSSRPTRAPATAAAVRPSAAPVKEPKASGASAPSPPEEPVAMAPPINLVGESESDIRARFGPPTSEEDRAPGKTWRYRRGPCSLDVSLYPDVQTRQFTTLAYEVRSDDNTDRGKQICLGQFQSHGQSR
jgi:hypothetical protein